MRVYWHYESFRLSELVLISVVLDGGLPSIPEVFVGLDGGSADAEAVFHRDLFLRLFGGGVCYQSVRRLSIFSCVAVASAGCLAWR